MTVLNHDLMDENELIYQFQHNYLKRNETFLFIDEALLGSICTHDVYIKLKIKKVLMTYYKMCY